jgi:tetratricopeptide (TPR) repeat protein
MSPLRCALAFSAFAVIALSNVHLPDAPKEAADGAFVPDPKTARATAFGFHAALADLHWLRAVQIVGGEHGASGRNATLGALIDVVTTLDPYVDHAYRFAAVWLIDDEAAVRKGNELLERAIEIHPDDWRHYFYLGFNRFYYLDEQPAAAAVLRRAIHLEGSPPYLGRLAARLESQGAGLDSAAAFLQELLQSATEERERLHYSAALREIETERRARFLDAARAEYVRRFKRDLSRVDELVSGRVLRSLPADPYERGWEISEESGEIVSAGIRYRYRLRGALAREGEWPK